MVVASDGGIIAAGYAGGSFGNGDLTGMTGRGGADAIIVKFDNNGNVIWKKNFGGAYYDVFYSVTAVSDGIIAVGYSVELSFSNGDFTGIKGKGGEDAIIVKYDNNGNIVWKKNFGGSGDDRYNSVTVAPDGKIVAVGYSSSFNSGDWAGIGGRGDLDATIVKYDTNGTVIWKKNFGGSGIEVFNSVTATSDGIIAVGSSDTFTKISGKADLNLVGKGGADAFIVKFDNNGNVIWKKNFGGSGSDTFLSVTAAPDGGVVATGYSSAFNSGDWVGIAGKGQINAIIVKYDNNGNVIWKKNFGGSVRDQYNSVAVSPGGWIVAVGYSSAFNSGDWVGIAGKGGVDAIVVKYNTILPVTGIVGVPLRATLGVPLTLTGTVVPSNASVQTIAWSVKDAGTTFATIDGNTLTTKGTGTVVVTATISNGLGPGKDFKKDYVINSSSNPSVVIITATCDSNSTINPNGPQVVSKGGNQSFTFSAKSGYMISSVTVDGVALSQAQMDIRSFTFANVTVDHTIEVKSVVIPPKYYYITATCDSGSTISPSGQTAILKGSNQAYTFSAKLGSKIISVMVDGVALSQTQIDQGKYTFSNLNSNHTIEVKSNSTAVIISASCDSGVTMNICGDIIVQKGSNYTFNFSAVQGYSITTLLVDGVNTIYPTASGGSYTFSNVTVNHSIQVLSNAVQYYYITATCDSNSNIFPAGTIAVQKGASYTFTFDAKEGYFISTVTVDGANVQRDLGSYTFSNVTANHAFEVKSSPVGGVWKIEKINMSTDFRPNYIYIWYVPSSVIDHLKFLLELGYPISLLELTLKELIFQALGSLNVYLGMAVSLIEAFIDFFVNFFIVEESKKVNNEYGNGVIITMGVVAGIIGKYTVRSQ